MTILPDEERLAAEEFCSELAATFNPEGLEEIQLARAIAENYWRLNQARAAIANRFALSLAEQRPQPLAGGHPQIEYAIEIAETFDRDANTLRLISLYEQRTFNLLQRQKRELEAMQKKRQEQHQAALKEAQALYRHATAKGEAWNAEAEAKTNGGFVFSTGFLSQTNARADRLQAATALKPILAFRQSAPRVA